LCSVWLLENSKWVLKYCYAIASEHWVVARVLLGGYYGVLGSCYGVHRSVMDKFTPTVLQSLVLYLI